jgi:hypothetical protein
LKHPILFFRFVGYTGGYISEALFLASFLASFLTSFQMATVLTTLVPTAFMPIPEFNPATFEAREAIWGELALADFVGKSAEEAEEEA